MNKLLVATRKSRLALWQANHVVELLNQHYPDMNVELLPLSTRGDEILDRSLQKVGGKGLFIKELEHAMLEGKAHIAVHSMKDVPQDMPQGFCIAAVLKREQPYDVLVAHDCTLQDLPQKAVVGTSSQRRASQLLAVRPDLKIKNIRGNVETRLNKWHSGEFDAIVLAQAGLIRLGLEENISQILPPELSLPAAAQGIIGIECLEEDQQTKNLLSVINNRQANIELCAERAFNQSLGGDCHSPIAAFAQYSSQSLLLKGLVSRLDGQDVIRVQKSLEWTEAHSKLPISDKLEQASCLGTDLAEQAKSLGALELLS